MPTVSVIIPTYNRKDFVQEAIDSVLAQTYEDYEIIVVDDGSTDGTVDVLQARYDNRIRLLWQENRGESAARNRGIGISSGCYVALLDSDDRWLPQKLERQIAVMDGDQTVGMTFSQAWLTDEYAKPIGHAPLGNSLQEGEVTFQSLLEENIVAAGGSTAMISRDVLYRIGGFDESIRYGEDWDLWLRISAKYKVSLVAEPLALIRQHRTTQSYFPSPQTIELVLRDHLALLEKALNTHLLADSEVDRGSILAKEYGLAALGYAALGEEAKALTHMKMADALDPVYLRAPSPRFRELVLYYAHLVVQSEPIRERTIRSAALVRSVLELRKCIVGAQDSTGDAILTDLYIAQLLFAYDSGEDALARSLLLHVLVRDPSKVRERGVSAKLPDLFLGRDASNLLRSWKHRLAQ